MHQVVAPRKRTRLTTKSETHQLPRSIVAKPNVCFGPDISILQSPSQGAGSGPTAMRQGNCGISL
jgi:hypothetical protein